MNLSIIIPVYNAAEYLDECLASVFDQPNLSQNDYEVICVNDGSTDASAEILERCKADHPNLKVITQQNRGVSASRNVGIRAAEGTYLGFVDCDDIVIPGTFELALSCAEQYKVDMLIYGFSEFFAQQGEMFPREMCMAPELQNKAFTLKDVQCCSTEVVTPNVWRILFLREFIDKHGLLFHEDLATSEDLAFIYEALFADPAIALLNERLYLYRRDTQMSLTHNDRGLDGYRSLAYIQRCIGEQGEMFDVNMRHFINLVIDVAWYALGSAATLDEFIQLFQGFAETWAPLIKQHEDLVSPFYQSRLAQLEDALAVSGASANVGGNSDSDANTSSNASSDLSASMAYLWARYTDLRSETESLRAHLADTEHKLQLAQETTQYAQDELARTRSSHSYKAGRALLFVPSRIKHLLGSRK